jgi:hypothetical protein
VKYIDAVARATRNQDLAIGEQRRGVKSPRCIEITGEAPCARGGIVKLGTSSRRATGIAADEAAHDQHFSGPQ